MSCLLREMLTSSGSPASLRLTGLFCDSTLVFVVFVCSRPSGLQEGKAERAKLTITASADCRLGDNGKKWRPNHSNIRKTRIYGTGAA